MKLPAAANPPKNIKSSSPGTHSLIIPGSDIQNATFMNPEKRKHNKYIWFSFCLSTLNLSSMSISFFYILDMIDLK